MNIRNILPIPDIHSPKEWRRMLSKIDLLGIFEQDPFGNSMFIKRSLICVAGLSTYWRTNVVNRTKIEGTEHIENLPNQNVFFISNQQTYFADVIAFYQIFCAVKWGWRNTINLPVYFLAPRARTYYVAAKETMQSGLIPKILSTAGALTVERSWRAEGKNVKREIDTSAGDKISEALQYGWVVSFPQGTTSPYAPVRKGTAHIIKENKPIVIPVVIDGFRRAFDKKGLAYKKRNTVLSVRFKAPLQYSDDMSIEELVDLVRDTLNQDMPERIASFKAETELRKAQDEAKKTAETSS